MYSKSIPTVNISLHTMVVMMLMLLLLLLLLFKLMNKICFNSNSITIFWAANVNKLDDDQNQIKIKKTKPKYSLKSAKIMCQKG